jgi:hypothetical protein
MKTMFLLSAVLIAAACGGGGGGDPDAPVINRIDARVGGIDAPPSSNCGAPSAGYGTPVVDPAQQASVHDAASGVYFGISLLNTDFDMFQLQLYDGFGVFTGGTVTTGTFPLTGDEINFATCGVCLLIFSNTLDTDADGAPDDLSLDDPTRNYYASAGSVTITSLTPNLTGTVTGLVLDHVTVDVAGGSFTSTVVGDCSTSITSMAFDSVVTEQKRAADGTVQNRHLVKLRPN